MSDTRMSDERPTTGSRTRRSGDRSRKPRATTKAVERELSDAERLELWNAQFHQSILPDIPVMEGYHVCWLTTQNPRDSIPMRIRMGYSLIQADEVPGYDHASVKTGDYAGCIVINEMIAAKLPLRLYHAYMKAAHHDAPAREERKLADTAASIREHAERQGARIDMGDGMVELGKSNPASRFHDLKE